MGQRIAIFDYQITPNNPIGGCHRRMLAGLCEEHEFTVFAVEFDNPCPERIHWVRIPAPRRPLALLFVTFHILAPLAYLLYRVRTRTRFDVIQMVESNLSFGDVAYSQFCHRSYLAHHWPRSDTQRLGGMRPRLRWLDHALHAWIEPWVYRRVRAVVVPSRGLREELGEEYPRTTSVSHVISNPVDISRMKLPADFDREACRRDLGIDAGDVVFAFTALGHFERKGLPLLYDALVALGDPRLKLLVVGGLPDIVATYRERAERMGLADRVIFTGQQRDIRPYLWAADAFGFPSSYETFSLSTFEAAAAGLPVVVTRLHGVEDMLRNGENGLLVERTPEGVTEGIGRVLALSPAERTGMGERAQQSVNGYATEHFVAAWRRFYADLRGSHVVA